MDTQRRRQLADPYLVAVESLFDKPREQFGSLRSSHMGDRDFDGAAGRAVLHASGPTSWRRPC